MDLERLCGFLDEEAELIVLSSSEGSLSRGENPFPQICLQAQLYGREGIILEMHIEKLKKAIRRYNSRRLEGMRWEMSNDHELQKSRQCWIYASDKNEEKSRKKLESLRHSIPRLADFLKDYYAVNPLSTSISGRTREMAKQAYEH